MTSRQRHPSPTPPARAGGDPSQWITSVLAPLAVPMVIVVGLCAVIAVATLLVSGSDLIGGWAATASLWLVVHQVPFTGIGPSGDEATVGVLPLLPTAGVVVLVAQAVRRVAQRVTAAAELWGILGASVGVPLLVSLISWGIVDDASATLAIRPPNPGVVVAATLIVHLVSVALGLGTRTRFLFPNARDDVPTFALSGLRLGVQFLGAWLAVGGVLTVVGLVVGHRVLGELLSGSPGDVTGLVLLSLMYLPNIMVLAGMVAVGGGVDMGQAQVSLFAVHHAPLPPVPVMAVIPDASPMPWWQIVFVLPAVAVFLVARRVRGTTVRERVIAVLLGALTAGMGAAVAAGLAGGQLGVFGDVASSDGVGGLALAGWCLAIGVPTVLLTPEGRIALRTLGSRRSTAAPAASATLAAATVSGTSAGASGEGNVPATMIGDTETEDGTVNTAESSTEAGATADVGAAATSGTAKNASVGVGSGASKEKSSRGAGKSSSRTRGSRTPKQTTRERRAERRAAAAAAGKDTDDVGGLDDLDNADGAGRPDES